MEICKACQNPLTIEIDPEDDDDFAMAGRSISTGQAGAITVPDDVGLQCGCHFHWQCLLDAYNIIQCPSCSKNISSVASTGAEQVLCSLHNEGGLQSDLDIFPLLKEESYLKAFPEERKARAFLEFCAEGDVGAILDLVNDDDDPSDDEDDEKEDSMRMDQIPSGVQEAKPNIDILRYQDSMNNMDSGLHVAVLNGREEIAWLLLLLASNLDPDLFPADVRQAAETLGARREDQKDKTDIRMLENSQRKMAHDLAQEAGGVWLEWVERARLKV
ncbi:MAG: hypothetical protein Q9190_003635 [Brigantiaea leucoxantha]